MTNDGGRQDWVAPLTMATVATAVALGLALAEQNRLAFATCAAFGVATALMALIAIGKKHGSPFGEIEQEALTAPAASTEAHGGWVDVNADRGGWTAIRDPFAEEWQDTDQHAGPEHELQAWTAWTNTVAPEVEPDAMWAQDHGTGSFDWRGWLGVRPEPASNHPESADDGVSPPDPLPFRSSGVQQDPQVPASSNAGPPISRASQLPPPPWEPGSASPLDEAPNPPDARDVDAGAHLVIDLTAARCHPFPGFEPWPDTPWQDGMAHPSLQPLPGAASASGRPSDPPVTEMTASEGPSPSDGPRRATRRGGGRSVRSA